MSFSILADKKVPQWVRNTTTNNEQKPQLKWLISMNFHWHKLSDQFTVVTELESRNQAFEYVESSLKKLDRDSENLIVSFPSRLQTKKYLNELETQQQITNQKPQNGLF